MEGLSKHIPATNKVVEPVRMTESSPSSEPKATKAAVEIPRSRINDSAEPRTSQGPQCLFSDSTTKERGKQQTRASQTRYQRLSLVTPFGTNWPSLPTSLSQDSSELNWHRGAQLTILHRLSEVISPNHLETESKEPQRV